MKRDWQKRDQAFGDGAHDGKHLRPFNPAPYGRYARVYTRAYWRAASKHPTYPFTLPVRWPKNLLTFGPKSV